MDELSLTVPDAIVDALPADGEDTKRDMERAVAGWEQELNAALAADEDAVDRVVTLIERFEERWETYDQYVVELRAWGQSPIYAMAWRNLHAAIVRQVYAHGDLEDRINRTRNRRIVEDGITFD